ncbi:hypothetical protein GCM10025791_43680 [Halioxenophilus aromaticivorans]|uniref:Secreted protein n=1 Tax=Halioxenophilus aromaticivorans TaxID=1306992 RepID=A0AAV3U8T5_9ALTE
MLVPCAAISTACLPLAPWVALTKRREIFPIGEARVTLALFTAAISAQHKATTVRVKEISLPSQRPANVKTRNQKQLAHLARGREHSEA